MAEREVVLTDTELQDIRRAYLMVAFGPPLGWVTELRWRLDVLRRAFAVIEKVADGHWPMVFRRTTP